MQSTSNMPALSRNITRKVSALALVAILILSSLVSRASADAGDLDTSFDLDGIVITSIGDTSYATAVAIQADGKTLVEGYEYSG